MTSSYFPIISILGLSIIVQAAAAIMAIRLVGITGRRAVWCLIAAALVLMAVRRIVPLYRLITGDIAHPPDAVNEVIGLALSTAMAIGISLIAPLFHERNRTEEKAKEVAAEWLTTFNSTSDLFFLIDKDYRITKANKAAAAFLALPLEEIVGHYCHVLMHGTTCPLPECPLSRLQQSMKHEESELYLMAQDIWVQVTVDPILDEKGELLGAVHIVRDITQRKRAEEQLVRLNEELEQRVRDRTALLQRKSEELEQANESLKEVDRLKSTFIASMSHELRTPLNAVIGFSSVLLDEWVGPVNAEQRQNLASILSSGRHLLNMITDVLDVTQIEADTIAPVIDEFDLYDLLTEAESQITETIQEKGLELRSVLLHQRMRTDRRRLLQCVLNILSNAAKFTDKGSVTLEARIVTFSGETPEVEMVEIAVTDTGIGIGEEDLPGIFQPFSRIVIPERAIVPGTGLGLFLTRKIVTEILKGNIYVSSEYGKGSRFSLRIPVRLP